MIELYSGMHSGEIPISVGTLICLPINYVLKKRHIFEFSTDNFAPNSRLFFRHAFMGIFTTALFRVIAYVFHWVFGTDSMRYLGGTLGLTLGYFIKYRLDKRFVFVAKSTETAGVA